MTRSLPEWIGKTDDTAIPLRVKLRVLERQDGCCAECTRKLGVAGERIDIDHKTALINGGKNRESNLQALCPNCHATKTRLDVAEKSETARKKAGHMGFERKKRKIPGSKGTGLRKRVCGQVVRVKE